MERYLTTRAGYRRSEQRLKQAQAAYDEVVASNPEAAEAGDNSVWHDNFAFEENQRLMHQRARRVRDLRAEQAQLEVVDPGPDPREATVGCAVEMEDGEGWRKRYVIGGHGDGDAAVGRVAYDSPMGSALLGARVGERRSIPGGREVEILSIARAEEEAK